MWKIILPIFILELFYVPKVYAINQSNYTRGTDGNLYKFIADEVKWIDGSKKCNEDGAHLAIDDSPVVHNYIINAYLSMQFWIGVNELANEGTWRYNDGRIVEEGYWDDKQPDNDKKHDYCVMMSDSGRWYDDACTLNKPFLCQKKGKPDGYSETSDGNFYKYYKNKTNWHDANSRCNDDDAQLSIVDSDDVHRYLIRTFPKQKYWIGVNDLAAEGIWRYVDGRKVKKGYWEFGQPKNEEGACVSMWNSERWRVDNCSVRRPFLCQITGDGHHLIELMNEKIQSNSFTAPVIMGVIVIVIFLFIIWCVCKHRNTRNIPSSPQTEQRKQPGTQVANNPQPRFVINLNDTITINPQGTIKPISTIHKSVVFESSIFNPPDRISLPQVFENRAYMHGDYPPPSYYSVAS